MRFRFWLPVFQTAAMLLIVWAPWAPDTHALDVLLANGKEFRTWVLIPGPSAVEWAEGINLPASAVVTPLEFAVRKSDAPPNYKVRFYGFWLVGLLCWYLVGRFVDELIRWRRTRVLPPKNAVDLAFALIAVPSAALLAGVFTFGDGDKPVLASWGAIWLAITSTALLFRLVQVIRYRRKRAVS
jgi:hypothetical protein